MGGSKLEGHLLPKGNLFGPPFPSGNPAGPCSLLVLSYDHGIVWCLPTPTGPEKAATRKNPAASVSPKQRGQRTVSPGRPVPGLWYLAGPPLAYVSSVPVLPYPSTTV